MTNPSEMNYHQPILNLVQKNVSLEVRSLEKIKSLPHLQRVTTLVFLLLKAKSVFWEKTEIEMQKKTQMETERLRQSGITPKTKDSEGTYGFSISELDANSDWLGFYFSLDKRNREDLPKIIAEKIEEHGNPFGFGKQVTRSILEMANESYEAQVSDIADDADGDWHPNPTDFLEDVIIDMFMHGRRSGVGSWSINFQANEARYGEIFPEEVTKEMRAYLNQI